MEENSTYHLIFLSKYSSTMDEWIGKWMDGWMENTPYVNVF